MNFKLNEQNGKVKYVVKQKGGNVGGVTSVDSALWMLGQNKPKKSTEIEDYPIAVTVGGDEYFFSGEWLMGGEKDVLTEEPEKPEQSASATPRKRRTKDKVCRNEYCDLE